jgi:hypothetical protein
MAILMDANRIDRQRRRRAAALAATLFVALATSCIVVTGRTGDSLRFPLAPHARWLSTCSICHAQIDGAQVDSATRRSLEAACLTCHGDQRSSCTYCHTDPDNAGVFPARERFLTFNHHDHLQRTQGQCDRCHASPHETAPVETPSAKAPAPTASPAIDHPTAIPGHAQCFSCHQMKDFYEQLDCSNCHRGLFRFGLKPYEDFSHGADWLRREHGDFARQPANAALCSQCHEPSYCAECHAAQPLMRPSERHPERVAADTIHEGNYVSVHPWAARTDPGSCMRCHGMKFCEECHTTRGISERGAAKAGTNQHFHGPGVLVRGSPDFHGSAARRDIIACASCHSNGASGNCVSCHAVGAFGGNPHPPGFKSRLSRTGAPVCRLCHSQ